MRAIYLRFADEPQALAALADQTPLARDDVGTVWRDDAGTPIALDGWHVNLIVEGNTPESLAPFVVAPVNPMRRFAGY